MIILKNYNKSPEVIILDDNLKAISPIHHNKKVKGHGWFIQDQNSIVCMYVANKNLHLKIFNECLVVNSRVKSTLSNLNSGKRLLTVFLDNSVVIEHEHDVPIIDPPVDENDFTPFVEKEHFDFYMRVNNVISNVDRQQWIIESSTYDFE